MASTALRPILLRESAKTVAGRSFSTASSTNFSQAETLLSIDDSFEREVSTDPEGLLSRVFSECSLGPDIRDDKDDGEERAGKMKKIKASKRYKTELRVRIN